MSYNSIVVDHQRQPGLVLAAHPPGDHQAQANSYALFQTYAPAAGPGPTSPDGTPHPGPMQSVPSPTYHAYSPMGLSVSSTPHMAPPMGYSQGPQPGDSGHYSSSSNIMSASVTSLSYNQSVLVSSPRGPVQQSTSGTYYAPPPPPFVPVHSVGNLQSREGPPQAPQPISSGSPMGQPRQTTPGSLGSNSEISTPPQTPLQQQTAVLHAPPQIPQLPFSIQYVPSDQSGAQPQYSFVRAYPQQQPHLQHQHQHLQALPQILGPQQQQPQLQQQQTYVYAQGPGAMAMPPQALTSPAPIIQQAQPTASTATQCILFQEYNLCLVPVSGIGQFESLHGHQRGVRRLSLDDICKESLARGCRHKQQCRYIHMPNACRPLPDNLCYDYQRQPMDCGRVKCRFFHGPETALRAARDKVQALGLAPSSVFTLAFPPDGSGGIDLNQNYGGPRGDVESLRELYVLYLLPMSAAPQ